LVAGAGRSLEGDKCCAETLQPRRSHVIHGIGRLTAAQLVDVERLVMVFLGLAD